MGSRSCSSCGHVFWAHGPDGCRTCGCTDTRGVDFQPFTSPDDVAEQVARILFPDSRETPKEEVPHDADGETISLAPHLGRRGRRRRSTHSQTTP
jgi:hypothetical protein